MDTKKKMGFVLAATNSGAGKTILTLGMIAALKRRGLIVQPFKVGPDFIDPGHHAHLAGRDSRNLDGWMLPKEYNQTLFTRQMADADCAVVEGVMGLFDGYDSVADTGSTAEMAKWLKLPVVLVVNAASMARSAAAVVKGFESFDPGLTFAGVIFNRVGSETHLAMLREAISHYCRLPCLGGIPRDPRFVLPERHLGLVTREEMVFSEEDEAHLAESLEAHLDLDALLERSAFFLPETVPSISSPPQKRVRIAVARDAAFCFYYPDNLEMLEQAGAQLVPFSPLTDTSLPPGCQGMYLGGGYPEEFAESLAQNVSMRTAIREAARKGCPIYAECGGFMYLCREIVARDGKSYPMAGVFPFGTRMLQRFRALGYREVTLMEEGPLGTPGLVARGHEFHYSEIVGDPPASSGWAYRVTGRKGVSACQEGYRIFNTLASYIHLHFGSNPRLAENWVDFCAGQGYIT